MVEYSRTDALVSSWRGHFAFPGVGRMGGLRIGLVMACLFLLPVTLFAGPVVSKGDHIERVIVGLSRVGEDQTADIQEICGPSVPTGVLVASLWGPPGATADTATVQTYRLQASAHPFAAAFYLGRDASERPVGLALADHQGIVTGVYTGDPSSWPVLCDSL